MDFRELHLGTQFDEENSVEKRAFFSDFDDDDELEDYSANRIPAASKNDSPAKKKVNITEDNVIENVNNTKKDSVMTGDYNQNEDSIETTETIPVISEEVIQETGEFDISDIEGIPYAREGGRPIRHKEKKEQLYGSTYVSKTLGLSPQAIRNYCDYFEDYLQIQKKESRHRAFRYEDIERLRQLIKIKDEKNFTFEQLKEFINKPDNFEVIPESQRFESAIEKMEQVFETSLMKAISYVIDSNSKLLEQKDAETAQLISGVSEQLKKQDDTIAQLIEIITDEKKSSDESLSKIIEQLQSTLSERDKRIEDLVKMVEQQNSKIVELETKKQKKFFKLF